MHSETIQLFRMLVEAGATPGEDFSYDMGQASCRINERGFLLLQNAYPDVDWSQICQVVERDFDQPKRHLETALGTDFVAKITASLEYRLTELTDAMAAWYVQQLLHGVEQRTGISLFHYLQKQPTLALRLDALLREPNPSPCNQWIGDLILAAGGTEADFEVEAEDVLLTEQGMALFSQVWSGDYDLWEEDLAQSA
jgi:hypothetical protein